MPSGARIGTIEWSKTGADDLIPCSAQPGTLPRFNVSLTIGDVEAPSAGEAIRAFQRGMAREYPWFNLGYDVTCPATGERWDNVDAGAPDDLPDPDKPTLAMVALIKLLDWARENTGPRDPNSPHTILVECVDALKAEGWEMQPNGNWARP